MIYYVLGQSGTGKTQYLVDEANKEKEKNTNNIVFINTDDDKTRILDHKVRVINAKSYGICCRCSLKGFIAGILARDYDIGKVYVDGIYDILDLDSEGLEKLTNDLKVLLISDPETDISAASLSVNVGSMSDPWEIQGLAHFLEHMLFMGTKKVRLLFQIIYNRLMKNYLFYIVRSIQMKMNIVNFYHNMVEIPMLTLLMV